MKNEYDDEIIREQKKRLSIMSMQDIRLTVSALAVISGITALSLYLLRF